MNFRMPAKLLTDKERLIVTKLKKDFGLRTDGSLTKFTTSFSKGFDGDHVDESSMAETPTGFIFSYPTIEYGQENQQNKNKLNDIKYKIEKSLNGYSIKESIKRPHTGRWSTRIDQIELIVDIPELFESSLPDVVRVSAQHQSHVVKNN